MTRSLVVVLLLQRAAALTVPLPAARPAQALDVSLARVADGKEVHLGEALAATSGGKTMLCLGTHACDFNTIEYMQKLRFYAPRLRDAGVDRVLMVVNGDAAQTSTISELVDLPGDVELFADPTGEAGRKFGCSRGFRPDDASLSPFVKLFVVGIGLGPPWGTLVPVLAGYFGNPNGRNDWVVAAMQQAQQRGRAPTPLKLAADGSVVANAFDDAPLVGGWGRRPFELATMRLQSLVMQAQEWGKLKPADPRCLTQLGGCTVVGGDGVALYSWVDRGLCDIPDFEEILAALA